MLFFTVTIFSLSSIILSSNSQPASIRITFYSFWYFTNGRLFDLAWNSVFIITFIQFVKHLISMYFTSHLFACKFTKIYQLFYFFFSLLSAIINTFFVICRMSSILYLVTIYWLIRIFPWSFTLSFSMILQLTWFNDFYGRSAKFNLFTIMFCNPRKMLKELYCVIGI